MAYCGSIEGDGIDCQLESRPDRPARLPSSDLDYHDTPLV